MLGSAEAPPNFEAAVTTSTFRSSIVAETQLDSTLLEHFCKILLSKLFLFFTVKIASEYISDILKSQNFLEACPPDPLAVLAATPQQLPVAVAHPNLESCLWPCNKYNYSTSSPTHQVRRGASMISSSIVAFLALSISLKSKK